MMRPPRENSSDSIFEKGQGPAIQDTLAFRNCLLAPASSEIEPTAALHLPSGEQGGLPLQETLPLFTTSRVLAALPTPAAVVLCRAYLTRTFAIVTVGFWSSRDFGVRRTT